MVGEVGVTIEPSVYPNLLLEQLLNWNNCLALISVNVSIVSWFCWAGLQVLVLLTRASWAEEWTSLVLDDLCVATICRVGMRARHYPYPFILDVFERHHVSCGQLLPLLSHLLEGVGGVGAEVGIGLNIISDYYRACPVISVNHDLGCVFLYCYLLIE